MNRAPEYSCEIDWEQASLNGWSYCFHRYLGENRPCGRASYWAGHHEGPDDVRHEFVSLSDVFWTLDQVAKAGNRKDTELTRLRAENERLTAELQENARLGIAAVFGLEQKVATLTAECEELRADVVWAVYREARSVEGPPANFLRLASGEKLKWDGTPADIQRAVREARNG